MLLALSLLLSHDLIFYDIYCYMHTRILDNLLLLLSPGADPGGGGGGGLSESLGIDFYNGFRKKSRYTLL